MANSTVVTLRISTDIYNVVREIAEKEDIPASFVIRRAIKKGLGITQSTTPTRTTNTPEAVKTEEVMEGWE